MKKLISIGVVVALLALVVLPGVVGADTIMPSTYAKIPFAIVQSGFYMLGCLLGQLQPILTAAGITLPLNLTDVAPVLNTLGGWVGVPLAWSVDMLTWGVGVLSDIVAALPSSLGVPAWVGTLLTTIETDLGTCFVPSTCNNVSNAYTPPC